MTTEYLTEVAMFQVGQLVSVTKVLRSGAPSKQREPGFFRVTKVSYTYGEFQYDLEAASPLCQPWTEWLKLFSTKDRPSVRQRYVRA